MANLDTIGAQLDIFWQRADGRWRDLKTLWNDPVRRQFEKEHWVPLAVQVLATEREMHRLAEVIARARRMVR